MSLVDPGRGYRLLAHGETREEGDEVAVSRVDERRFAWMPVSRTIGKVQGSMGVAGLCRRMWICGPGNVVVQAKYLEELEGLLEISVSSDGVPNETLQEEMERMRRYRDAGRVVP